MTTSRYAAARIEGLLWRPRRQCGAGADRPGAMAAGTAKICGLARSRHFTVLAVCKLYRRKRIDLLLQGGGAIARPDPGVALRIVGSGPEGEEFRAVWRAHHLEATVGGAARRCFLSRLARHTTAADIFCLPSMQEGFGIVFLEAMAAGKPIVAARVAAVPEVCRRACWWNRETPKRSRTRSRRYTKIPSAANLWPQQGGRA